jgi:hypothetical protein
MMLITKPQLGRLQTLYSQLAAHEIGVGTSREERIRWATERLGKPVESFKALTGNDAGFLIDSIQSALGVKAPLKKRPNREQARRAGLDGRKDGLEFAASPQIATADDLARIERMLEQLGWTQERFRNFLASTRSPFAKRSDKAIRTTADANKAWWALKRMARGAGIWRKKK